MEARKLRVYRYHGDIDALAGEFKELKRQEESIKAQLDELKARMIEELDGRDEYTGELYKVSNKEVHSTRLNTKDLQTLHPDIYKLFSQETVSHRFTVS